MNTVPEVLIIGGGIIGCAVAEALSHRGADVALVDPRGIGQGATQASAGMLTPYSEGRHDPCLERLGARSLEMYEPLIARLSDVGAPPVFVRAGSLDLALTPEECADLGARAEQLSQAGIVAEFLSGDAVRGLEPHATPHALGGLHVPVHAYARAADLARLMWATASGRGAQYVEGRAVGIARDAGGGLQARLTDRVLQAKWIVLAGGSWAGEIPVVGLPPMPVRPVRGQLLQLAWPGDPPRHIIGGPRCYTLTWPDGTMLAGATVEDVGFDERATAGGVRQLLDGLFELVPGAAGASFTRVRVGFRPSTPDSRPIVGASERLDGLVYATGHYRNGVLLAPLTGELVARVVAGEDDPALQATRPQRFADC